MSQRNPRSVPTANPERLSRYTPIPVASLRLNSAIPFVLYTQIEGEYLIYRRENLPFTHTQREALLENHIDQLFVSPDEARAYWDYLTGNIQDILVDESVSLGERSSVLYSCSEELSRRIVSNPVNEENISLARSVVTESIRLQAEGKSALHQLMCRMAEEPGLHTHALNVCQYALALAQRIDALSREKLEGFGVGLMLMDLGMLAIPDNLAFKDGPLSFDEWNLVKRHPGLGLEAIDGLGGIPDIAREVIFGHHERLDGSGYPQGLKGGEISLPLRIVGVCEAFASLTTGRSFRDPMSSFEAIRQMRMEMRASFDPQVLEAFISLLGAQES